MANKNLPKYENPPPPPPKSEDGKAWAKYYFDHLQRKAEKEKGKNTFFYAAFGFAFLMFLSLLLFMNNKQQFDFYQKNGVFKHFTAEMRVEKLVSMLIDALYIPVENGSVLTQVDRTRLEHFEIDGNEPINFGNLKCVLVEAKEGFFKVTIDGASPNDCPSLCTYIEKYMAIYGWAVVVIAEW